MSRQFIEEFIKLYESELFLWYIKLKNDHDRNKKDTAYAKLIKKKQRNRTKRHKGVTERKTKKLKNPLGLVHASADSVYHNCGTSRCSGKLNIFFYLVFQIGFIKLINRNYIL